MTGIANENVVPHLPRADGQCEALEPNCMVSVYCLLFRQLSLLVGKVSGSRGGGFRAEGYKQAPAQSPECGRRQTDKLRVTG